MAIPKFEKDISYISKLADQPNDTAGNPLSAAQLKDRFDAAGNDIKAFINDELVPAISEDIAAAAEGLSGGGQLGEEKIADGAISASKLAVAAVRTSAMADAAVTTAKMADGATVEPKIADGAVTTKKIAKGAVTYEALADESVSANKIFTGAVITQKIADGAVSAEKIANGAVTRAKLANDALYSPMRFMAQSHTITAEDIGCTLADGYSNRNTTTTAILTQTASTSLPLGTTIAITSKYTAEIYIELEGIRCGKYGDDLLIATASKPCSLKFDGKYGTVALKKVESDNIYGDMWILTGNAEVVS